jgi:predicted RNA polymerase sigma factor
MAFGPAAGLEIIDAVRGDKALQNYLWLPSVRADLLTKLGRDDEARLELGRALGLTANARERELLQERLDKLGKG